MFISKEEKKELNHKYDYLLTKFANQEIKIQNIIKKINELSKIVKPIEIPNYQNIFKENK